MTDHILTLSCPDQRGIVHAVAGFLAHLDCNILDSAQFGDADTGRFFMRVHFAEGPSSPGLEGLRSAFAAVSDRFAMSWQIHPTGQPTRALILVSRFDHCLHDLLYRHGTGELAMDVRGVVSNHPDTEPLVRSFGLPYHHLPVTPDTKAEQEVRLATLIDDEAVELVVLARYMQILSADFVALLAERIVNIHHSFLPSFKGARPYQQAHGRGVKLIGATAHFVTPDLDEGPIIEQDVVRVDHAVSVDQMVAAGRDVERVVLARAVRYFVERRLLLNDGKTVVFR